MPHLLEPAPTGRAKCRGCGRPIAKGELRFGQRIPNPFKDGEDTTIWFHPLCAAYKCPEPWIETLGATSESVPGREALEHAARSGLAHRRLPRIDGAERSPSGQAKCRACKQAIERGAWRIRLAYQDEGRFTPGGFVHLGCGPVYFETGDLLPRLLHFSSELTDEECLALISACELQGTPGTTQDSLPSAEEAE